MQFNVLLLFCVACFVNCFPQNIVQPRDPGLITYINDQRQDGYNFEFETVDGTKRQESGSLTNDKYTVVGSYQFVAPNGETYTVTYEADENGYRAKTSKGIPSTVQYGYAYQEPTVSIVPAAIASLTGGGLG